MRRSRTVEEGKPDKGSQSQACVRKSLVRLAWGGSADEWWRLAGGGTVQVDGRSAPVKMGGGERVQRDIEVVLKGERWGGDRR